MNIYIPIVLCFMLALILVFYRLGLSSWYTNTKRVDIMISSFVILSISFIILSCKIDRKFDSSNIVDKWSVLSVERKEVIMKGQDNVISTRELTGMVITDDIEKGVVVKVKCRFGIFYINAYFINY